VRAHSTERLETVGGPPLVTARKSAGHWTHGAGSWMQVTVPLLEADAVPPRLPTLPCGGR
jgi:hypothetical protein